MKTAAIYTRVSSDQQKENKTIESQVDELQIFAKAQGFMVPGEYVFKDAGYSGATLIRPGLERVRDLSAEGQLQAILIYSPDRLSRNYAYQVVLMDEFVSCGVEVVFMNAPKAETPEENLLLQFQGMISEYERAIIKERSRRGKRYKAKMGVVSVLGGAPYGYNYIKKTDGMAASYEVNEDEAVMVQKVYTMYSQECSSIGAITRMLNEQKIPTKKRISKWERSTVWAMLRNPAYIGKACFGKTECAERKRVTKPLRAKGGYTAKNRCNKEKPRDQWIEIPVPGIIDPAVFAIVQQRLKTNKLQSRRNTKVDTLLQGMMVCSQCGYSLYRTFTTTSAKNKIYYYRCFGSDAYRFEGVRKCTCKPVRQDYLDQVVWDESVKLLGDPELIQKEIIKRVESTRQASPILHRKSAIEKQRTKLGQAMDKLLDAYQEGLIPIGQLRKRMPDLQKRIKTAEKELETLKLHELSLNKHLELLDVQSFTKELNQNLQELDIKEKKKILRLLVKEVIVGEDIIDIRHSIPLKEVADEHNNKSYQLCTRTNYAPLRCSLSLLLDELSGLCKNGCFQPPFDVKHYPIFGYVLLYG